MYIGEPGTGDDVARAAARAAGGGAARLAPHARLGHVPGVARIASKGGAAHAFWTCRGHMSSRADAWLCAALLPAFDVASTSRGWPPRDVRVAVSRASDVVAWAASQTFPVVWIVKPREGSYLSRGMHVVTMSRRDVATPAALDAWVLDRVVDRDCRRPAARRGPECDRRKNVTFQRYVHRTALVRGRKFDVRVWVLVTSVDPLRLYVLRHGYPKIASRAYTGTRDLGDQCRHVRLMLDPACVRGAGEFLANFPDGYPKSTASPVFHDGFELVRGHAPPPLPGNATATAPGARARWVDAEHFWQATVWPNVERALTAALLLARRDLLRAKAAHERADPAAAGLRRFALLAPDLAVDRRGRVYVEEINANGKIMGTHGRAGGYRDLFHDDGYVRAFLRIVGVDAHPEKKRYGGALAAALDHFCAAAGGSCAPGDRADLEAAVDEEAHAGPHWYRLYPPTRCVAARHGGACETDADGAWWPEQARVSRAARAAMGETPRDATLRAFLAAVDTEAIHGAPAVPGHGRWSPRAYRGTYAP